MSIIEFVQNCVHRFQHNFDPRSKDWLMISPAWPVFLLCAIYLLVIYVLGPKFMENRRPFNLKPILTAYNFGQIAACLLVSYWFIRYGLYSDNMFQCNPIDYSDNEDAVGMVSTLWYAYLIKMFEFVETIMFVLRKKNEQITYLHVYHHVTTLIFVWATVRFTPGGVAAILLSLNTFVHILMYSYYLISVFIVARDKLVWLKKLMTLTQMIQFIVMAVVSIISLVDERCYATKIIMFAFVPNVIYLLNMFRLFYIKKYLTKPKKG